MCVSNRSILLTLKFISFLCYLVNNIHSMNNYLNIESGFCINIFFLIESRSKTYRWICPWKNSYESYMHDRCSRYVHATLWIFFQWIYCTSRSSFSARRENDWLNYLPRISLINDILKLKKNAKGILCLELINYFIRVSSKYQFWGKQVVQ